jgi:hypothetical protein
VDDAAFVLRERRADVSDWIAGWTHGGAELDPASATIDFVQAREKALSEHSATFFAEANRLGGSILR